MNTRLNWMDWIAAVLVIIGALNWGLIGLFGFDSVAFIFGELSVFSRVVYSLVGLSGLWMIFTLVRISQPMEQMQKGKMAGAA
ncbi:MAG: DUF378 domain-containing protein [Actinobacteria bacterium]|nr:MAG: DUF378 domain-containing protein [Actinomycetota bacterium]